MFKIAVTGITDGSMTPGTTTLNNTSETIINSLNIGHVSHLSPGDQENIFRLQRKDICDKYGLAYPVFMTSQDPTSLVDTNLLVTKEIIRDNPEGCLPEERMENMISLEGGHNVSIGQSFATCPVVVIMDVEKDKAVMARCGFELLNKKLPEVMVRKFSDSDKNNLYVYVGPYTKVYETKKIPRFITSPIWNETNAIRENDENKTICIEVEPVIKKLLLESGIPEGHIEFSPDDTTLNPNYFTRNNRTTDPQRVGRNALFLTITQNTIQDPKHAKILIKEPGYTGYII